MLLLFRRVICLDGAISLSGADDELNIGVWA